MLPFFVVHFAGHGRQNAVAHVRLAHAVLVPVGVHIGNPVFAQRFAVDILRTELVDRAQPGQLQVQIVVGQGLARRRDKSLNIVELAGAFIGPAHGAADVFTDPAGVNFVIEPVLIEFKHKHSSFSNTDYKVIIQIKTPPFYVKRSVNHAELSECRFAGYLCGRGCLRLFSPRQDQLQDNSDRDIRGGLPPLPQRDGDWPVRKRRRVLLYGK